MLALPTVKFLRKEKNVLLGVLFLLQKMFQKAVTVENWELFFQMEPSMFPKMSVTSFCSFPLSQPWPNSLATTFFLLPAVLNLPNSSLLPPAFILLRSALPAVRNGKQMALACVFCTLQGCEMMGSFGTTVGVCQEGQLMLSTVINNRRLQQSGFTAFPISLQEMTKGCTFLCR